MILYLNCLVLNLIAHNLVHEIFFIFLCLDLACLLKNPKTNIQA